jgi:uncharacterized protein DUF222/HNH endonuclease
MELMAELPAADGAVVAGAIEQVAASLPKMPDDDGRDVAEGRRADALVALCSGSTALPEANADADASVVRSPRPRIVLHAPASTLARPVTDAPNAELDGNGVAGLAGAVLDPPVLRRLACDAEVQVQLEDTHGEPLRLGRTVRVPSAALARAVRVRDKGCRFPACGNRRFAELHHIVWWSRGGTTDIDNLALVCAFHHRLVHEHGWALRRDEGGLLRWIRPDGVTYRAGPSSLD